MRKTHAGPFLAFLLAFSGTLSFAEEQDMQTRIAESIDKLTDAGLAYQGKRSAIEFITANPAVSAPELVRRLDAEKGFEARLWLLVCINGFDDLSVFDSAGAKMLSVLDDERFAIRFWGIKLAGRMGNAGAVQPLTAMLESEGAIIKREAARSLGLIGHQEAVEPVIKLLQDEDKTVRAAAVEALGNLKAKQAVPQLVKMLEDESVLVIFSTVTALEKISEKSFGIQDGDWLGEPGVWKEKIRQWLKADSPEENGADT